MTLSHVLQPERNEKKNDKQSSHFFSGWTQFLSLANNNADDYEYLEKQWNEPRLMSCISACGIQEFIMESGFITNEACVKLISAIVAGVYSKQDPEENNEKIEITFAKASLFRIELMTNILLVNRDRISVLWPLVSQVYIHASKCVNELVQQVALSGTMRLLLRLASIPSIHNDLFDCTSQINTKHTNATIEMALSGTLELVKINALIFLEDTRFKWLQLILQVPGFTSLQLQIATCLTSSQQASVEQFGDIVDLLVAYSRDSDVALARLAVQHMHDLHIGIPSNGGRRCNLF